MRRIPRELLPHEAELVETGVLRCVTHVGARCHVFEAEPGCSRRAASAEQARALAEKDTTLVYRHMADKELAVLLERHQLPATQPYQTIVRGDEGLRYCRKYITGKKRVDTDITTIVEFCAPSKLVEQLFAVFHKAEDGCVSTGLGDKAGKTLPLFNAALADGSIVFCPIVVKRAMRKAK